jgi:hypothetical protein
MKLKINNLNREEVSLEREHSINLLIKEEKLPLLIKVILVLSRVRLKRDRKNQIDIII